MIALGKTKPFFFLHEYKPEKGTDADPFGQLLIAMLAAQANHEKSDTPLYGCYVLGRNWFLVTLEGQKYAVSLAHDSTQDDISQIVKILKRAKKYIENSLTRQT